MVSELTRKRLDTRSIIQLLRGLDAPPGMGTRECSCTLLSGVLEDLSLPCVLSTWQLCSVTVAGVWLWYCGVFVILQELQRLLRSQVHFQLMESWSVSCFPHIFASQWKHLHKHYNELLFYASILGEVMPLDSPYNKNSWGLHCSLATYYCLGA